MRILHIVHQYPPDHVGGTEIYTQALARYQAAEGHAVSIFSPEIKSGDRLTPTVEEGVRVYRAGDEKRARAVVFLSTLHSNHFVASFDRVLAVERPDIVHLQHLMGLPVSLVDRLDAIGIPYVITLHDYWYGCANAQLLTNYDGSVCAGPDFHFFNCGRCTLARAGAGGLDRAAPLVAPLMSRRNRLLRGVFTRAAATMASTPFVREAYGGMGFPISRVRILPLGIDASAEEIASARATGRRRKSAGQLHIGYVGGLNLQKGVHHLVAAVNRLPETVALSIYGDPTAFPDYVDKLRRMATHPGIRFKGAVSRSELWLTLGELDVVVVPTLWYETYSLIIQEAFAAGLPVVASNIGVIPDVVREGVDGLLFPPGDVEELYKILLGFAEYPERIEILRAGLPEVPTMEGHAKRVITLYDEVLGDTKPTPADRN